ncbi:MAG: hypothetical protein AAF558_04485 [Verrucomicrobiota bacterium]
MKKLLIVSPHFPPINAPDHQRVRMMLPYFQECGWKPTVLCVAAKHIEANHDTTLLDTLPDDVSIEYVEALPAIRTPFFGFGNLSMRSSSFLKNAGNRLLATETFEAVFFSTTQVGVLNLGPYWKAKWNVPYFIDIQDPIYNTFSYPSGARPPGGRLKYFLAQTQAKRIERTALPGASHIVTVTQDYETDLKQRLPQLTHVPFTEMPFPFSNRDFNLAGTLHQNKSSVSIDSSAQNFISAGRGGSDLTFAHSAFFKALNQLDVKTPNSVRKIQIYFLGTRYDQSQDKTIDTSLLSRALQTQVHEYTQRVPYLETLSYLKQSSLNLVFGSTDERYSASKIMPVLSAGQPFLALLHKNSRATALLKQLCPEGLISFDQFTNLENLSSDIFTWLIKFLNSQLEFNSYRSHLERFEAKEATRSFCELLDTTTSS